MTSYRVPPRLAYVVSDDVDAGAPVPVPEVYLMRLPDAQPVIVQGTAAMIWLLAAEGEDDVAAAVGDVVGLGRAAVVADVDDFLGYLCAAGLLEMVTSDASR